MLATDLALKISQLPIGYQILIYIGMFIIVFVGILYEATTSEEN